MPTISEMNQKTRSRFCVRRRYPKSRYRQTELIGGFWNGYNVLSMQPSRDEAQFPNRSLSPYETTTEARYGPMV